MSIEIKLSRISGRLSAVNQRYPLDIQLYVMSAYDLIDMACLIIRFGVRLIAAITFMRSYVGALSFISSVSIVISPFLFLIGNYLSVKN